MENRTSTVVIWLIVIAAFLFGLYELIFVWHRTDPGNTGFVLHYKVAQASQSQSQTPDITIVPPGTWAPINPWRDIYSKYPIAQQTLTMVKSGAEGQIKGDDSTKCQDKNVVPLFIDSSTLWRVDIDNAARLYLLRPGLPLDNGRDDDISSVVVRREVRNAITVACSEFKYDEIFLGGREAFRNRVQEILGPNLAQNFIKLDGFLPGEIHLLPEQEAAINQKVVAQQQAEQAAFLKQKAENEANANVAQAEGAKKVKILQAEAESEYIKIVNEQLGNSPLYIKYVYASKWDGVLPTTLVMSNGQEFPLIGAIPLDAGVGADPNIAH